VCTEDSTCVNFSDMDEDRREKFFNLYKEDLTELYNSMRTPRQAITESSLLDRFFEIAVPLESNDVFGDTPYLKEDIYYFVTEKGEHITVVHKHGDGNIYANQEEPADEYCLIISEEDRYMYGANHTDWKCNGTLDSANFKPGMGELDLMEFKPDVQEMLRKRYFDSLYRLFDAARLGQYGER